MVVLMNLASNVRLSLLKKWRSRRLRRLSERNLREELFRLALPATAERLLSLAVGIVDTVLVGHLGDSQLAAVSLAGQWVFMAFTFFDALATGSTALVARATGAGDRAGANRAACQSLLLAAIVGAIATVLTLLFARPAMMLLGAAPDVAEYGAAYLRIAGGAFTLQAVMWIANASLRGAGDTRSAMKIMSVVNVINIVVSWAAVNGRFGLPEMGVAGSALGSAVARVVGGILALAILLRGRAGLRPDLRDLRFDLTMIRRVVRVGLPTSVERGIMRLGMMTVVRMIAQLGTVAVAAYAVTLRAESLSFMPGFGFAVAGTTLVGQSLGARDPKRAERGGYLAYQTAALLMGAMGIVFILFPRPLIALFTSEEAVITAAVTPLRIVGFVQPFLAATLVFPGSLRGAGDTRFPMFVTSASTWAIRIPATILFAYVLGLGLNGVWLGMSVEMILRGFLFYLRFRSGRWKTARV